VRDFKVRNRLGLTCRLAYKNAFSGNILGGFTNNGSCKKRRAYEKGCKDPF